MVPSKISSSKIRAEQDGVGKMLREASKQHPGPPLKDQKTKNPPNLSSSRSMKANKRRRKEEAATAQDYSSSSLPPAKKSKQNATSAVSVKQSTDPAQANNASTNELPQQQHHSEGDSFIAPELLIPLSAYEVANINIISSSQIQAKVTRILETLASFSFVTPTKPSVVLVHAKGSVASKLITIVEIAKREISRTGGKWYQYNGLDQFMAIQGKKSTAVNGTGRRLGENTDDMEIDRNEGDPSGDDNEGAFETMKTPLERAIEGKPKVKAIPVLTTYLSRVRIGSLKEKYG
jgi:hypothetical protein